MSGSDMIQPSPIMCIGMITIFHWACVRFWIVMFVHVYLKPSFVVGGKVQLGSSQLIRCILKCILRICSLQASGNET